MLSQIENLSINLVAMNLHIGIILVDSKGFIKIFNKYAKAVLDIEQDREVEGSFILDIIPNSRLVSVLKNQQPLINSSLTIKEKTIVSNIFPIYNKGFLAGAIALFQGMDELDKIANELKSYKNLYKEFETIIESSYDGIYVTDGHGNTIYVNAAYERNTGLERKFLIGKNVKELEEKGYFSPSVSRLVLKEKKAVTVLQDNLNGKKLLVTGTPVYDDRKNISKVVINNRDFTEIINLKDQLENQNKLIMQYHNELKRLRENQKCFNKIVFQSASIKKVIDVAINVADYDVSLLILGESGVGKEKVAEIIHEYSSRSKNPFIKINCAAIPETLMEAELFGYEDGAFTGAKTGGKIGLFEVARNGTILLDEIGEIPLGLQSKLLRVLQEKEFYKINGIKPIKLKARIIASTNRDLKTMVEQKLFREDLYYRLNVVPIYIPPLRERREDIEILVNHFLRIFNENYNKEITISPEVLSILRAYGWPGNIRELMNLIERIVITTKNNIIRKDDLPEQYRNSIELNNTNNLDEVTPLYEAIDRLERNMLENALKKGKTIRGAAKILKINPSTMLRKVKKLNVTINI
ncbi:MAG: sigma 54-interacting transcriptional regulator [Bacillota bacterium]